MWTRVIAKTDLSLTSGLLGRVLAGHPEAGLLADKVLSWGVKLAIL